MIKQIRYIETMPRPDKKPELLVPCGKPESFWAAMEGGADAVYFGLKQFNARTRAMNFTLQEMHALIEEAHRRKKKAYLTLNTVITNRELPALAETLVRAGETDIDGIIVQDWGVCTLIRKHFPDIPLHASTQMGIHNTPGARSLQKLGFRRIIFARELTQHELASIRRNNRIEMEIFIHGALCYSFSGSCLFSSYLGGFSANRGACMQPCRRNYRAGGKDVFPFSLRDLELIGHIPDLIRLGIDALKIEGRIKSAEYAYTVARAYRMAIDYPDRIGEAKAMLKADMGREKTGFFIGGSLKSVMTGTPATGLLLGTVQEADGRGFSVQTDHRIETGNRLRIQDAQNELRHALVVPACRRKGHSVYIEAGKTQVRSGDRVYLASTGGTRFPTKLRPKTSIVPGPVPQKKIRGVLSGIHASNPSGPPRLYLRLDAPEWIRQIRTDSAERIILKFSRKDFHAFDPQSHETAPFREKIIMELPKFIPEADADPYRETCSRLSEAGIRHFMLGHFTQKELVPRECALLTNENVYAFNDAAVSFLKEEKIGDFIYPFENDIDNLLRAKDKTGIVPLYFRPELFFSRTPVHEVEKDGIFVDLRKKRFQKRIRNGMTVILPEHPVALFPYKNRLIQSGFRKFLIDLSWQAPSGIKLKKILDHYQAGTPIPSATSFNFKKGLK
ncbi:U32 family peptidase [bacterium]|nr:U32 family peptidase [bacterium]